MIEKNVYAEGKTFVTGASIRKKNAKQSAGSLKFDAINEIDVSKKHEKDNAALKA